MQLYSQCIHTSKLTAKGHLTLDHMFLRFEVIFSVEICADNPPDQRLGYFPTDLSTFFAAVPGKPTGVTLLEALKDYMVLGWSAPAKDGGADIRGYFVDYRTVKGDVVGKWHEMNHQAVTTTSYKVSLNPKRFNFPF